MPSPELPVTRLRGHTVLVGYGQVGSRIGQALKARGVPFLVIDELDTTAEQLRAEGIEVICGNAGQRGLLEAANLAEAKCLISAIANPFEASNLLERARRTNPNINIHRSRPFRGRGRASRDVRGKSRRARRARDRARDGQLPFCNARRSEC